MPKPKRIFIALNIPDELRQILADFKNKWPELPCRWVKPENLHVTLAFLGNTGEKELEKVESAVEKTAKNYQEFLLPLEKISYGPPGRKPPSLIWIEGKRKKEIITLKKDLDEALNEVSSYKPEKRKYIPHITLGRIKKFKWRALNPEQRPQVKAEIDHTFTIKSIDVMESVLKRSGAEYTLIKSCKLKK